MNNLQEEARELISGQIRNWELAHKNYSALKGITSKNVDFDGFSMTVQFNPERARSTTAPVDQEVVRPCFLCIQNRPAEQEKIDWQDYEILINPYPIFNPHLTIPHRDHIPQYLTGHLPELIRLADELSDFVITFNGARSGASAPDHLHFQAVEKKYLPAVAEIPLWEKREILFQDVKEDENIKTIVWGADKYLRPAIIIESTSLDQAVFIAGKTFSCLTEITSAADEAQVNALSWKNTEKYTIVFFPRTNHRPKQYYAGGEEQFLFSPGAVDMAGVMITVRPSDFEKVSPELIADMFSQVVPDYQQWQQIKSGLKICLSKNLK